MRVYAKPTGHNYDFELIKTIKCDEIVGHRFAVNSKFGIENEITVQSSAFESFEVFATSDIIVAESGNVAVSGGEVNVKSIREAAVWNYREHISHSKSGLICLISGGNVVNEGTLTCKASGGSWSSGGAVYINTDGVFENKGVIDCGRGGHVHIECAQFKNNGKIIPEPEVTYKRSRHRKMVKRVTAREDSQKVNLEVVRYRGYTSYGPTYLVQEGTSYYYQSQSGSATSTDWIVFKALRTKRIYPTGIVIRNYQSSTGIKRVRIYGSADGARFEEWIEFGNISNRHYNLQTFAVDPISGKLCC